MQETHVVLNSINILTPSKDMVKLDKKVLWEQENLVNLEITNTHMYVICGFNFGPKVKIIFWEIPRGQQNAHPSCPSLELQPLQAAKHLWK